MQPGNNRTYADVTAPLRKLTNKNVKLYWSQECKESFKELKFLLTAKAVMANFEVGRQTRLYVDHGPEGVASTVAQLHGKDWRPVLYTGRSLTETEKRYSKVEGESLGVLTGIRTLRTNGLGFIQFNDLFMVIFLVRWLAPWLEWSIASDVCVVGGRATC